MFIISSIKTLNTSEYLSSNTSAASEYLFKFKKFYGTNRFNENCHDIHFSGQVFIAKKVARFIRLNLYKEKKESLSRLNNKRKQKYKKQTSCLYPPICQMPKYFLNSLDVTGLSLGKLEKEIN